MAAGLPVITTPVGSAAEIVRDGETGFVIAGDDPAILSERIATVLNDAELRARMGAAGRARVEHVYEEKKNAARFERVLLEAAASGVRPRGK
jgi:glycosyltransferase involved in cell wall biosynthesis